MTSCSRRPRSAAFLTCRFERSALTLPRMHNSLMKWHKREPLQEKAPGPGSGAARLLPCWPLTLPPASCWNRPRPETWPIWLPPRRPYTPAPRRPLCGDNRRAGERAPRWHGVGLAWQSRDSWPPLGSLSRHLPFLATGLTRSASTYSILCLFLGRRPLSGPGSSHPLDRACLHVSRQPTASSPI